MLCDISLCLLYFLDRPLLVHVSWLLTHWLLKDDDGDVLHELYFSGPLRISYGNNTIPLFVPAKTEHIFPSEKKNESV